MFLWAVLPIWRRPCSELPISLVGPTVVCPSAVDRDPDQEEDCAGQVVAGDKQGHADGHHRERGEETDPPQARRTLANAWGHA